MLRLEAIPLALLLSCGLSAGQVDTARLEGVVKDASGSVVPGARVSVLGARTQFRAEVTVDPEGLFVFPSLQPGLYTLNAESKGFSKTVVSGLELNVGGTVFETVTLQVGEVAERITVAAGAVRVENSNAQISRAITLRDIDVLPQLDRAPIQLAIFNPGIQIDPTDWYSLSRVNGTRQGSNSSKLDGIDANDSVTPRLLWSPSASNTDSIEEFRIVTNGGKAEYGRSAGAQIDLITRSGTNIWHGNAFEYLRNTVLNASTFFNNSSGSERPDFIQNIFGASLGGPLHRDRTFLFSNFQGQRTAQQVVRNRNVLTPEAKAGLFRWRAPGGQALRTFDIGREDPRGKGIDPQVAEILKLLPAPNNSDIGDGLNTAGYRFNTAAGQTGDQFTVRADHSLWSGHRVFFRWTWGRSVTIDTVSPGGHESTFPGQTPGTFGGGNWAYSAGSDWAFTAYLVNELRVGGNVYAWDFLRPARLPGPMLLANSWTNPLNPAFSNGRHPAVRQLSDSLTIVRGKHIVKAGVEWRLTSQRNYNNSGIWPNVSFALKNGNIPSEGPTGAIISSADRQTFEMLYNDLLGRIDQVKQTFYSDLVEFQPPGTPRVRAHRFREYGYFVQDDWKLRPGFVLNLGLRYEFSGVPFETGGFEGKVDKAALVNSSAHLADLAVQRGSRWYNNDFNNFAPRIGLAWDLSGDGKTALRANWGIFYDRLIGSTTNAVDSNTPGFSQVLSVFPNRAAGADYRVSDGIPLPQRPAAPVLRLPPTRSTDLFLFTPNLRTGYVQHYSLTLQREIVRDTVIEAGYIGTHGVKLFMDLNLNQPRIYDGFLASFRELQTYRERGTMAPGSNTLVRIFGSSTGAAVDGIGASIVDQGAVGSAADSMDRNWFDQYARAGVSEFYLRNFPQFDRVVVGLNAGRSYYDSFQLSLRRQAGALKFVANYTFSKSIDNTSSEGQGFTSPIDNFNVRLNRARGDYDIPHAFNSSFLYSLPFGRGRRFAGHASRWADLVVGGWDLGLLTIWQSGRVVTYLSGRATGPTTGSSFVNYTGDRNVGRVMRQDGAVSWLTPLETSYFSFPEAGEIGTGGRNAFRGPRFFNADISLVKEFGITERHAVSFRAEAYNLLNNANFGAPNVNLSTINSFGRLSSTVGNARVLQMALRYAF